MQNRTQQELKRKFYDLFSKDSISLETNIVNDLLYELAKITFDNPDKAQYGLILSQSDKITDIKFKPPIGLTPAVMEKLINFLHYNYATYALNTTITLDPQFVFEGLFPELKALYESKKPDNPQIIKYQIESKPKLESAAIATLNDVCQKTLEVLFSKKKNDTRMSVDTKKINDAIDFLQSKLNHLYHRPFLYKRIISSRAKFEKLLNLKKVTENENLKKQINAIIEAIDVFAKYNRYESVLANKKCLSELEKFLNKEKISSHACHIIEETILDLSGAKLGPHGKCNLKVGHDQSRLVFNFEDITQEEAQKVVNYLQNKGDKTAIEGYGLKYYADRIPESFLSMSTNESLSYDIKPEKVRLESHAIETDGSFFFKEVYLLLKIEITKIKENDPARFKKYQDLSEKHCKPIEKKETKHLDKLGVFATPPTNAIDSLPSADPILSEIVEKTNNQSVLKL